MTNEETLIHDNELLRRSYGEAKEEIEHLKKEKDVLISALKQASEALGDLGYDLYSTEINEILKNVE